MSSTEKTEHGTYRVRYRTPDGRSRSKTFKRRADADAFAATVETSKLQGTYTDPSPGKTRFGDWAKHVQVSRINLAPSTRARDDSYFRSFMLPYFANETLARVNPLQVQRWMSALVAEDYAPGTIRKAYQLLSAVFDAAVNSDLIPRSPCRGIKLPKDIREELRFLSPEEVEQLADAIDPRYRALVLTAAYTGLRSGELLGLKVNRLDAHCDDARVPRRGTSPAPRSVSKSRRVGVLRTAGRTRPSHQLPSPVLAAGRPSLSRRAAPVPRPPAHSCRHTHRPRSPPESGPGSARPRVDHNDAGHVRAPGGGARRGRSRGG